MSRNNKIPPLYHFGVPLNQEKVNIGQTCFGANAGNLRCPLSKLKDLFSSGSMMDAETLKSILPSLFQTQSANKNSRCKAKRCSRSKMKSRICIDVNKLDEISSLSSGDKGKIRNILSLIQCESESQRGVATKAKHKTKKVTSFKRVTKSYAKENLAAPSGPATSLRDSNRRTNTAKARGYQVCPGCRRSPQMRVSKSRLSIRSPKIPKVKLTGLNASQQHKLLQALIDLDNPDLGGDTPKGLASQLESARQPNRINIRNFKVKYVSPTYVVQYNGEDKPTELHRERFYSNVALESHLGQRPPLSVLDNRKDRQSMHYEDSTPYIVGVGATTEQMLREEQPDSSEDTDRQSSPEDRVARSERAPWQRESIPGYLKPPTPHPPPGPSHVTADQPSTVKSSRCQRLVGFVRRVLCMSGTEKPQEQRNGEDKPKRRVVISDDVETPCVRTTKSQFFRIGQNK